MSGSFIPERFSFGNDMMLAAHCNHFHPIFAFISFMVMVFDPSIAFATHRTTNRLGAWKFSLFNFMIQKITRKSFRSFSYFTLVCSGCGAALCGLLVSPLDLPVFFFGTQNSCAFSLVLLVAFFLPSAFCNLFSCRCFNKGSLLGISTATAVETEPIQAFTRFPKRADWFFGSTPSAVFCFHNQNISNHLALGVALT